MTNIVCIEMRIKIIILLSIFCCSGIASKLRSDLLKSIVEFSDIMATLPKATGEGEKSFESVVRLSLEVWLEFGTVLSSILDAYDSSQPDLEWILGQIDQRVEFDNVAATLLAAYDAPSADASEMTASDYDRIAAHTTALSMHFLKVIELMLETLSNNGQKQDESEMRATEKPTEATQYEEGLFADIAKEIDELWYSIMNYLPMEEELSEIDGFANSKADLATAMDSLAKWTDSAKGSLSKALVPLVEVLQQVGHRIDALGTVNVQSRRLDWIMNMLYLENSFRFQASACELIFIARHLEELEEEEIAELDPAVHEEFSLKTTFINGNFTSLDALLKDIVTRLANEEINNSRTRMEWWEQFRKLFENGNAMKGMLEKILKHLPAPLPGRSVDHYSAASLKFKSQLPEMASRLSARGRIIPDDL